MLINTTMVMVEFLLLWGRDRGQKLMDILNLPLMPIYTCPQ